MRGLAYRRFGVSSLRRPKTASTSGLNSGDALKWFASSRTPYWICRSDERLYESPSEMAPVVWLALCSRGESARVYDAGRLSARSASELKVKVPSAFVVWSRWYASSRISDVNLMRCLLFLLNQESWLLAFRPSVWPLVP